MKIKPRDFGVLVSVTSLPSRHGIGDFGKGSYDFVDLLAKTGAKYWQILPLAPIGYGHSPYQPYSSYAIDEQFIDLDDLTAQGLLGETPSFQERSTNVRYEDVRAFKLPLLREAYEAYIAAHPRGLASFVKDHPWAKDWSVFSMYHRKYPMSWNEWPSEAKGWIATRKPLSKELKKDADFEIFLQKIAYEQWGKLHAYANAKGIQIIGDIPFYVGFDSCDVWANQDCFRLNPKTKEPDWIAGVPPDYFSATGQRWGNPIYDWKHLEETDFAFIENRILINAKIYDVIRLDHFRAFDTYWVIPASCPTAIDGKWIEAPGYDLFDSLFEKDPSLQGKIIAEDLGDLRPEVLNLRDHYLFPGMNVVEFTFEGAEFEHKVGYDDVNCVVYLGTHDNDTMASYFSALTKESQKKWLDKLAELGYNEGTTVERLEAYCLGKKAIHAILAMQDILELGGEARTNVPSTVDDRNWTFKLADLSAFEAKIPFLSSLVEKTHRK